MMPQPPYIDVHTHQISTDNLDAILLCSFMAGELKVNLQVERASVGIHPYQLRHMQKEGLMSLLETDLQDQRVWALGEAGLDRSIAVDIEIQKEVFEHQALLSEKLQLPLVIHAVRSFDLLLQLHKTIQPSVPWIIHGFAAALPTAMPLIEKGFYLSVGAALFDGKRPIAQALNGLPLDKIFFETDMASVAIEVLYNKAAEILNIDREVLRRQIFANFAACFKKQLEWNKIGRPVHDF